MVDSCQCPGIWFARGERDKVVRHTASAEGTPIPSHNAPDFC